MNRETLDKLSAKPDKSNRRYNTGDIQGTAHFIGDTIFSTGFRAVKGVVNLVIESPDFPPTPQSNSETPANNISENIPEEK